MSQNRIFLRIGGLLLNSRIGYLAIILVALVGTSSLGQELTASTNNSSTVASVKGKSQQQVLKITGVRFSYPLVQKWIDEFATAHPDIQVIIESRGTYDPSQYDILIEGYEHPETMRHDRQYLYVGRYAILPIASAKSSFAVKYVAEGLDKEDIIQVFFHDPYSDRDKSKKIITPFTVYTRLQKAAAPIVFSSYFGFEQKDIKGKTVAGSDEHLIKALQRDSAGVSFAPVPLIYDHVGKNVVPGISVIPVDLNGNGKVSDEELAYKTLPSVLERFETSTARNLNNVPIAYLHFSVEKKTVSSDALTFLNWILGNSGKDLADFGYLKPEAGKPFNEQFREFAAKHVRQ